MRTLLMMCALIGAPRAATSTPLHGAVPSQGLAYRDAEADTGILEVTSDPPAHVLIDDVDTKTVTPQPHLELKAGHHKLTLVTLDGSRKRTLGFNVEAGQTTKLAIHLSP